MHVNRRQGVVLLGTVLLLVWVLFHPPYLKERGRHVQFAKVFAVHGSGEPDEKSTHYIHERDGWGREEEPAAADVKSESGGLTVFPKQRDQAAYELRTYHKDWTRLYAECALIIAVSALLCSLLRTPERSD